MSEQHWLTVSQAARALGIPGRTVAGQAQKLRRLERSGVLPAPRRSLVHGDRAYDPAFIAAVQRALREELAKRGWP